MPWPQRGSPKTSPQFSEATIGGGHRDSALVDAVVRVLGDVVDLGVARDAEGATIMTTALQFVKCRLTTSERNRRECLPT